jgi:hypothetical protein
VLPARAVRKNTRIAWPQDGCFDPCAAEAPALRSPG